MKSINAVSSHGILVLFICFLGATCFGQEELEAAPMEKTELEALYSTIQGFVGNRWNGSDLYPDPCGWTPIQGVSCDLFNGFWYVTALNIGPIHENSISCSQKLEFRPHLFEFKHLASLSFFNCFLSRDKHPVTIPTENWEKLYGNLESLEFRSNPGLIGKIPKSFGLLKNLKSLVLLGNGLTGEIPPDIGNLMKLKRLVLAENSFSGQIPDIFNGLSELLILDLSRNALSGPLPSSLGSLTSLLKLDVSNNNLEGNLLKVFANLKNLTLMDLRNNRFQGGLVLSIQEIYSLEELALSNNPIGGSISGLNWENLQNLVILELSNMGLTGEIPESITELKRLRFLGLRNNHLTGNLTPKLETLPSLNALYLSGNNLTGDLKFSQQFYDKMGSRFGAWDNPNLCYPVGEISSRQVPFGVRPCHEEVKLLENDSNTKLLIEDMNQTPQFMASLGFSSYAAN
ncbi:LOW QUALITY PROTEIN: piriformospora indica-insensitive protein 2-like [Neltuma alba]|uniref:LOW QUALITY PROTEIN: piriformospora indica-insensitive protein 2-like n=1 Tax=Neltuma alba TaxID=207710 RepID=UPI0010A51184|nr:LOW QUALITY PROTEIN: piriformospora indica-insensitive protein 2-like [Prosopis alba]